MGYKFPLVCAVGASTTADGYAPWMNCQGSTNFTDEASAETPFFEPGKLSYMSLIVWSNGSGATSNPLSRKNGANGNMNVSIPAGATGTFVDSVNSDTVANGDVACCFLDRGGGSPIQFGQVSVYYETDSGVIVNKVGVMGSQNSATGTGYVGFIGDLTTVSDNTAGTTPRITVAGTVKNFHAYSNSNTRTKSSTIRPRYNGANGNLVVTFNAGTSGLRTDTVNSDTLAINDNFNYQRVTNTGSGTFTLRTAGCEIHYPANEANLFSCDNGGISVTATTARFMVPAGSFAFNGSENVARLRLFGSGKLSDFYYNVLTNTATATSTIDVRINSASTAISDALLTTVTGTRSDTVDTATFADSDFLNYRYIKSTGSGTVTMRWFSLKITYDIVAELLKTLDDFTLSSIGLLSDDVGADYINTFRRRRRA
jgi:hypothetical protein